MGEVEALEQVVVLSNAEKIRQFDNATSASLGNYSNLLHYVETMNVMAAFWFQLHRLLFPLGTRPVRFEKLHRTF